MKKKVIGTIEVRPHLEDIEADPGPWKYAQAVQSNGPNFFAVTNGKWSAPTIAQVYDLENARLIAAAPDLLAALKTCAQELFQNETSNVPGGSMDKALKAARKMAVRAIAKAEGIK